MENKLKLYVVDNTEVSFMELEVGTTTIRNLSKSRAKHYLERHSTEQITFYINNVQVDRSEFTAKANRHFF